MTIACGYICRKPCRLFKQPLRSRQKKYQEETTRVGGPPWRSVLCAGVVSVARGYSHIAGSPRGFTSRTLHSCPASTVIVGRVSIARPVCCCPNWVSGSVETKTYGKDAV